MKNLAIIFVFLMIGMNAKSQTWTTAQLSSRIRSLSADSVTKTRDIAKLKTDLIKAQTDATTAINALKISNTRIDSLARVVGAIPVQMLATQNKISETLNTMNSNIAAISKNVAKRDTLTAIPGQTIINKNTDSNFSIGIDPNILSRIPATIQSKSAATKTKKL